MMKNTLRNLLAVLLVLTIVLGNCFSVFADDVTTPVRVENENLEIEGSIEVTGESNAATVTSRDNGVEEAKDTSLIVDGDVSLENGWDATLVVSSTGGKNASAEISGSVTSESDYTGSISVNANGENSTATATVGKGAEGAIEASAEKNGNAEVTVISGGVVVEGERTAVSELNKGGTILTDITGDVVSNGDAVSITNEVSNHRDPMNQSEIEALGVNFELIYDWTSEKEYGYYDSENQINYTYYVDDSGAYLWGSKQYSTEDPGQNTLIVNGNIKSEIGEGDNYQYGTAIDVHSRFDGSTATLNITGSVDGQNLAKYGSETALNISASDKSTVTAAIGGDVSAGINNGTAKALAVSGESGGNVNVEIAGKVSAISAKGEETAISASANGKGSTVSVKAGKGAEGSVSLNTSDLGSAEVIIQNGGIVQDKGQTALSVKNQGGSISAEVNGDVESAGSAISIRNDSKYHSDALTPEKIAALGVEFNCSTRDDGSKYYSYYDETNQKNYYYSEDKNGNFEYGYVNYSSTDPGDSTVVVNGNATSVVGKDGEYGDGTAVSVSSQFDGTISSLEISGNITAENLAEEGSETALSVSSGGKSTAAVTVGGSVSASAEAGQATGINASSFGEKSSTSVSVKGDVTASGDGEYSWNNARGIYTNNNGGTVSVDVGGDVVSGGYGVTVSNETNTKTTQLKESEIEKIRGFAARSYYDEYTGNTEYNYQTVDGKTYSFTLDENGKFISGSVSETVYEKGSTSIEVAGDVTATDEDMEKEVVGINASGGVTNRDTQISVGGDVTVNGGEGTKGINATSNAGTMTVSVAGSVQSNRAGLDVENNRRTRNLNLSEEEAKAMQDKFSKSEEWTEEDEDGTIRKYVSYSFYDEENDVRYSYTTVNGEYSRGSRRKLIDEAATTTVSIGKDIVVAGEESVIGIDASSGNSKGETNVEVGGDVSVASTKANATGIKASVSGGEQNITIGGKVSVVGAPQIYDETVTDEEGEEYHNHEEETLQGISANVNGADSKLNITVMNGVSAEATKNLENAVAIDINNSRNEDGMGELNMLVNGDVDSTGTAIDLDSGWNETVELEGKAEIREEECVKTDQYLRDDGTILERKIYYNTEGGYYYNEDGKMWKTVHHDDGETNLKVVGDVHGDDIGLDITGDQENTNIIIDGTLSGYNSTILVDNSRIDDSMTLSVWEILPDKDGHYVEKQIGEDKDGNPIMAEDEDFLKQIQYIIRIEPTQKHMISTLGTRDQDGYQVANEGDTVTLKLSIPAGYVVDGAYGDVDKQIQLVKDANGDYYLIVPRGGGVLLSLKMHRAAARTVKLTFNPNGGTVGGSSAPYTVTAYLNKEVTLPTPDEREGYDFLGWFGADYGTDDERWTEPDEDSPSIQKGGATFKAEADTTFTAVWKKK